MSGLITPPARRLIFPGNTLHPFFPPHSSPSSHINVHVAPDSVGQAFKRALGPRAAARDEFGQVFPRSKRAAAAAASARRLRAAGAGRRGQRAGWRAGGAKHVWR